MSEGNQEGRKGRFCSWFPKFEIQIRALPRGAKHVTSGSESSLQIEEVHPDGAAAPPYLVINRRVVDGHCLVADVELGT